MEPQTQRAVVGLFEILGPGVGIRVLKGIYPNVARRELEEMLRDYREAWVRKNTVLVHELKWTRGGTVWAMDYTEPPTPVDAMYGQILATRDLASGYQPRALPFEGKSMGVTRSAIFKLMLWEGKDVPFTSELVRKIRSLVSRLQTEARGKE